MVENLNNDNDFKMLFRRFRIAKLSCPLLSDFKRLIME